MNLKDIFSPIPRCQLTDSEHCILGRVRPPKCGLCPIALRKVQALATEVVILRNSELSAGVSPDDVRSRWQISPQGETNEYTASAAIETQRNKGPIIATVANGTLDQRKAQ